MKLVLFFAASLSSLTFASWEGDFQTAQVPTSPGHDGNTYLNFYFDGSEGCGVILVDSKLASANTTGYVKFQCRGEGFNSEVFVCRDDKQLGERHPVAKELFGVQSRFQWTDHHAVKVHDVLLEPLHDGIP